MAIKVESVIRRGEVYVKLDDVVKALFADFAELENDEAAVKKYIKHSVEVWEKYEQGIVEQANNR